MHVDVVIFGGGAAGLWTLDLLRRSGYDAALLEAHELGSGQTVASQGIIHGGLKYTLSGLLTASADAVSEMPEIWRRSLSGDAEPDLSDVELRADYCHLWRTKSLSSKVAMIGARGGLRVKPEKLDDDNRPAVLRDCPGTVARLDEQVIEPDSFIRSLAVRHKDYVRRVEIESCVTISDRAVHLKNEETTLNVHAQMFVFAAGAGNQRLLNMIDRPTPKMQRRPLHMVVARGDLPSINGHCVDGRATRATITSTTDSEKRTVWQIGGQISERGVDMSAEQLIAFAENEVRAILPGVNLDNAEWTTYRVDRAEAATGGGLRPDDAFVETNEHVVTVWPTKLALAPRAAEQVLAALPAPQNTKRDECSVWNDWSKPTVAAPPWEHSDVKWTRTS